MYFYMEYQFLDCRTRVYSGIIGVPLKKMGGSVVAWVKVVDPAPIVRADASHVTSGGLSGSMLVSLSLISSLWKGQHRSPKTR